MADNFSKLQKFKGWDQDQSPQYHYIEANIRIKDHCPGNRVKASEVLRKYDDQEENRQQCNEKNSTPHQPVFIIFPDELVKLADQYRVIICCHVSSNAQGVIPCNEIEQIIIIFVLLYKVSHSFSAVFPAFEIILHHEKTPAFFYVDPFSHADQRAIQCSGSI
jgi:hypothetical protein